MTSATRIPLVVCIFLMGITAAVAQDKKFEISPYIGGVYSTGLDVTPRLISTTPRKTVTHISPQSSISWGIGASYLATSHFSLGFNYGQQFSKLNGLIQQTGRNEGLSEMDLYNYHGILSYTMGGSDSKIRPFFFGGAGATRYNIGKKLTYPQMPNTNGGQTRFSSTWGGGVNMMPTRTFGVKLGFRWTPTYILSEAEGIWCSPYYYYGGCWVVGDRQYAHQFETSVGLIVRF
jgi:hypothetical protein